MNRKYFYCSTKWGGGMERITWYHMAWITLAAMAAAIIFSCFCLWNSGMGDAGRITGTITRQHDQRFYATAPPDSCKQ